MAIMRIEVKVDGELTDVFEFDTKQQRDPVSGYWTFLKSFSREIGNWNFNKFFGNGSN